MITLDHLIVLAALLTVVTVSVSLLLARARIDALRVRRFPFGWKYIEDQGPPLGVPLTHQDVADLHLSNPGRSLVVYVFGCSQCTILSAGVPALLEDLPDLKISVLSIDDSGPERRKHERVTYVQSEQLVKQMNFSVAPFVVYFEDAVPVRKGIVNTLEQLRLTVDPTQVHLDIRLQ